jgi:septation ring formation regulator EzrA
MESSAELETIEQLNAPADADRDSLDEATAALDLLHEQVQTLMEQLDTEIDASDRLTDEVAQLRQTIAQLNADNDAQSAALVAASAAIEDLRIQAAASAKHVRFTVVLSSQSQLYQ